MKIRSTNVAGGIYLVTVLVLLGLAWALTGCATTPKAKAHRIAVVQKTTVDGVGRAYLEYCTIVRKPSCIAVDEAAQKAGRSPTKEDRIACLRPCDPASAEKIRDAVDVVRTAQTALFLLLKGTPTEAELDEARKQLARAADQLLALLEDTGVLDLLGDAVGGI